MEHVEPCLIIESNAVSDESGFKIDYPEIDSNNPQAINQQGGGEILLKQVIHQPGIYQVKVIFLSKDKFY